MTTKSKARSYTGNGITVSFDARRCIHAARCVHGLPRVFDPARRPWIDPDAGDPEEIASVVRACPTGALQYELTGGGDAETPEATNTIAVVPDGPLYLRGELVFESARGEESRETRAALCRCGASANKPYCDNSHGECGFADSGAVPEPKLAAPGADEAGELTIRPVANGPLLVQGPVELCDGRGEVVATGSKGALCRCGASATRPFCDGSHVAIGFEAEA